MEHNTSSTLSQNWLWPLQGNIAKVQQAQSFRTLQQSSSSNFSLTCSSNDGTAVEIWWTSSVLAIQAMARGLTLKSISMNDCMLLSCPLTCIMMILRRALKACGCSVSAQVLQSQHRLRDYRIHSQISYVGESERRKTSWVGLNRYKLRYWNLKLLF